MIEDSHHEMHVQSGCTRTWFHDGPCAPAEGWSAQFEHPEATCQRCGRPNVRSWHTDNDLWNRVMAEREGIVCPVCFAELAEATGVVPSAWAFTPEQPR